MSQNAQYRADMVINFVRTAVLYVEQVTQGDWGKDLTQEERNKARVDMAIQQIKNFAATRGVKWNPVFEAVIRTVIEKEVNSLIKQAKPILNSSYQNVKTALL